MKEKRGPKYNGKCHFAVVQGDALSAESSVKRCVRCAIGHGSRLKRFKEDFYQLAMLTILEEMPKYDAEHVSGASFVTFIKSRVCSSLWRARKQELRYLPFSHEEVPVEDDAPRQANLLVDALTDQACSAEGVETEVIERVMKEQLIAILREKLETLPEPEHRVLQLKFWGNLKGIEVAREMDISEGRVSQLTSSAIERLKTGILRELEEKQAERQLAAAEAGVLF